MKTPRTPKGDKPGGYCTVYTNRWGQLMVAAKYGYRAWHFGR